MKNLFKLTIGLTIGIFFSINSLAQGPKLANVIPPSPNMQAFQKYGDIPVSAYTGIPNISIPLYTIKYRDISVPISLSYHASGIKVAEEASQVGLGWVINTGGSISRNIVGNDDLQDPAYFNGPSNTLQDFTYNQGPRDLIDVGPILNMFSRTGPQTLYTLDLTNTLSASPPYDFQPDQYYYNFPGHDGKFIMTRAKQALIQKQEKIAISLIQNGTNYTWEIKSTDGYIYDFNTIETYHDVADHVSAWYLTKITSPNGNTITYNYINGPNPYVTTPGSYSDSWDYFETPVPAPNLNAGYYMSNNTGRQKGQIPGRNYTSVLLDNIDFTNGIVKFNYSNNRNDLPGDNRLDSLSIYSKDSNGNLSAQPLKTVDLSYDYFNIGAGDNDDDMGIGNDGTPYAYERLRLLQVQQKGNYNGTTVKENPYVFTYNSTYALPSKGSFARDHWGYNNGKASNTSLIPSLIPVSSPDPIVTALGIEGTERDAVAGFSSAGSLTTIQYPSGGTTEFQFESNDYDEGQSQVNDNSYFGQSFSPVAQAITLDVNNLSTGTFSPSDTLDLTNEYIYTTNPLTASLTTVSINAVFHFNSEFLCGTYNPFTQLNLVTFDIYDITGTTLLVHNDAAAIPVCSGSSINGCMTCGTTNSYTYVLSYYNPSLYLSPGKYLMKVHVDPSLASVMNDIRFIYNYYANVSSVKNYNTGGTTTYATGGGQRILRIIDHSDANSSSNTRKYIYHYFSSKSGTNAEYSYGRRMSHPVYSSFLTTNDALSVTDPPSSGGQWGLHMMRSADSDNPLNGSAGGAVVGYDQVTELNGENGENGKTIYRYINSPDSVVAYDDPVYQLPIKPPFGANYPDLQNGSLLEQTDYVNKQGSFIKLKDVTNTYGDMFNFQNMITALDIRPITFNHTTFDTQNGGPGSTTSSTNLEDNFMIKYTSIKSQFPYLASTDEKLYDQADTTKFFETSTSYYYDNILHLLPTRVITSNSKGELITTFNKYPLDYTIMGSASVPISQGLQFLQNNNLVTPVIEKYVQKSNADGTNARVVSSLFTSYKTNSPLPDIIQATASILPMTNFVPSAITASAATIDSRYLQYIDFNQYDSYGNILQQQRINGINNGYIWDYNSSFPIAEVKNAVWADIAYTSFESNGTGNWTISSSARDNTTPALTGNASYNLANGLSKSGLTATTTYVVSYWTKNSSPASIAGTISGYPIKGTTTPGGWTYYEHLVTGQPTITLIGTGNIDEVRLYPQNAEMTSYTYVPLIGLTSIDSAKGEISYYQYDGLGRLINIKDQYGNIVKNYVYHYQGQ